MLKFLFFIVVFNLTIDCFSQTPTPGQLKITIESFKCLIKSWDGLVEFDGHGNEVFIDYGYRIYNPSNPGAFRSGAGYTSIFGSSGNSRIKAGTANAIGGIDNGNEVIVNTVVLNEHIDADNLIIFSPSVWEWDNSDNNFLNQFNMQLASDLNWMMTQSFPFLNTPVSFEDPLNGRFIKTTDKYSGYFPITKYNFLKALVNVQNNRPVGISTGTFREQLLALYVPAILLLDTKALITFYNHNKSAIENNHPERPSILSGIMEMTFTEDTYALTTSNGSYSLKLKVEFTPDMVPSLTPPPPPAKNTKQPLISKFPSQSINTTKENVVGKWVGTYGDGESSKPNFYSFQLNNDGTMQLVNERGAIIANGNYSVTNNVITGNYSYTKGSSISFIGTLLKNTISGTWGVGNNGSGGGKWVMNRN